MIDMQNNSYIASSLYETLFIENCIFKNMEIKGDESIDLGSLFKITQFWCMFNGTIINVIFNANLSFYLIDASVASWQCNDDIQTYVTQNADTADPYTVVQNPGYLFCLHILCEFVFYLFFFIFCFFFLVMHSFL